VEVYNPQTQQWRRAGNLIIARRQHTACILNPEEILVVGGRLENLTSIAAAEIFNIRTGKSTRVADFPYPINSGVSVLTASGHLLVFGGRSGGGDSYRTATIYEYDKGSNQWNIWGNMGAAVQSVSIARLSDGRIVVSGGTARESFTPFLGNKSVNIESAGGFSSIASMQIDRVWHSMAEWNKDSILTIGGLNNSNAPTSSVDWVNLTNSKSNVAPTMPTEHSHGQAINLPMPDAQGNIRPHILMIAGFAAGYRETSSIEILERIQDTTSSSVNAPRITSFTPQAGTSGTRITVRGRGFIGASSVIFGGVPAAAFMVQSDSVIIATLGLGASGTVRITTPVGSGFYLALSILCHLRLPPSLLFAPMLVRRWS
jgi:hypothetical protein